MSEKEKKVKEEKKPEIIFPYILRNDIENYDIFTEKNGKINLCFSRGMPFEVLKNTLLMFIGLIDKTILENKKKENEKEKEEYKKVPVETK